LGAHLAEPAFYPENVFLRRFQVYDLGLKQFDLLLAHLLQLHFENIGQLAILGQVVVPLVIKLK
jgi:hypothetical protein